MQELLAALVAVNEATDLKNKKEYRGEIYLTNGNEDDYDERVGKVIELANGELITSEGKCNWHNHTILKGNGFPVTCGEKDSFGWLSGCIHTKNGIIVYG